MNRFLMLIMFMLASTIAAAVLAAPPTESNGQFAEWFRGLKQPENGMGCCDISDCRMVEHRVARLGYEALITPGTHGQLGVKEPMWVAIPHAKIVLTTNPTGRAVVCWMPGSGVLCFVRPVET